VGDHSTVLDSSGLNDQVYAIVKEWIVTRKVEPGSKLNLRELAADFGVSRSPVYQALNQLCSDGLVSVRSRHGYFVSPLTYADVEAGYDVRQALELQAAEAVVGKLAPSDLARLREAAEATRATIGNDRAVDIPWYVASNRVLHEVHVDFAGNALLSSIYRRLHVNELMQRVLHVHNDVGDVVREHEELVAAFEAADAERVAAAIRVHVSTGKRIAFDAVEQAGGTL
jgi:DNA-binding GntR family transcriptional regulator